jgi:autotransporter-associated beta strand protein
MNIKKSLTSLLLLAAITSPAWSQVATPPIIVWKPVTGAQPNNANGAAPFYPTQLEQAYGVSALQASGNNSGAGQTIAIIDAYNYPNALSTLNTFSSGYINGGATSDWTLPSMSSTGSGPTFTQLNQSGGTTLPGTDPAGAGNPNGNWEDEEALDFEYVHAMAPKANIILYEANSDSNSDLYAAVNAARNNPAVSVVTMSWGGGESSGDTSTNSYFTTPGTKAALNKGVTFCASTGDSGQPGLYPAFSPNVVAVGGTSLYLNSNNSYSSETAWSWNSTYSWGGGGGISTVEAKPSYQTSYGTAHPSNILASTTARAIPDVAMVADPLTGVWVYDSYNASSGNGWFGGYGGTSLASPCFAGLVADADGIRAAAGNGTLDGATQTLPALYSLSNDFHDITSGNIDPNGNSLYSAGTGYDLATGLGSPIANQLVPDLADWGVVVVATSYHWASASSGNWSTSADWTYAVPNSTGGSAVINAPTTSQITITLDEPVTLGSLLLGNSAGSTVGYTISGGGTNTLTFNNSGSGATITVTDGSHQINAPVVLSDNLVVTTSGATHWTLSLGSASSITDNGGGFSLTMSGTGGSLVLGGSNTYTGGTTVSGGTLVVASAYALPAASRLTISAAGTVNLGVNALVTNDPNSGMTGGALLAASQYVGYSGTGTFTQSGGANSLSNGLYVGYNAADSGTYKLGGGLLSPTALFVGLLGAGTLAQTGGTDSVAEFITVGNSPGSTGTYTLNGGLLSAQYETLAYAGTGIFSQSGGTNSASTLSLAAIGGAAGTYSLTGGLLNLSNLIEGAGGAAFSFSGGTIQAASSFSASVPIILAAVGGNTVFNTQGNTLTLAAPLSGPGGLQEVDGGALVLSASNSYAGTTLVSAGTLDVNGTLGGGSVQVNAGATLGVLGAVDGAVSLNGGLLAAGSGAIDLGALSGSGTVTNDDPGSLTTLTIGGLGTNSSFSGTILDGSGITALTKTGSGTLILSGTDSYRGDTTVLAGRLRVMDPYVLPDGGTLIVGNPSYFAPAEVSASATAVPEPGTPALLGVACALGLLTCLRRRVKLWALSAKLSALPCSLLFALCS